MNVNLDKYYDTHRPTITLFGKEYAVDNDYKKTIGIQKVAEASMQSEDGVRKMLEYALVDGKKAADEVLTHPIPFGFFTTIQYGLVAAMTGQTYEQVKEAADAEIKRRASFRG